MSYGLEGGQSLSELWRLVQRPQAPAADLNLILVAILDQSLLMDVGLEPGFGVPVGVADIVAAHTRLEAKFASHNSESFPTELRPYGLC